MSDRPVTIASFETPEEAHAARVCLEHAGIRAALSNEFSAGMLWHLGTAVGGVKLHVAEQHAERATEILEELKLEAEKADPIPSWICPVCGEQVDAGFGLCWNCNAEYDPLTAVAPAKESPPPSAAMGHSEPVANEPTEPENAGAWSCPECGLRVNKIYARCPACGAGPDSNPNPYLAPRTTDLSAAEREEAAPPLLSEKELDDLLLRAWRASIIGVLACPPILNFYSMWLLMRLTASERSFTPGQSRIFYAAWAVNLIIAVLVGAFFSGIFLTLPRF